MNLVLAVTTYERPEKLKRLLSSFSLMKSVTNQWRIIVADDGSGSATLDLLEQMKKECKLTIVRNKRNGIHHQFNTIVRELKQEPFDVCFKCDDDIELLKPGWEKLYIDAISSSGYDHLCHFDVTWRPSKNMRKPVIKGNLVAYGEGKDVQGAFFTLTPRVIRDVGFMDTRNFGFRGVGHIDYTLRAARAGYNDINHPFDVLGSNDFIGHQKSNYHPALNEHLVKALESDVESRRKYALIQDNTRRYIDFYENAPSLTPEIERNLLIERLQTLEQEKAWYEKQYGHQPRWYVRLGKLLFQMLGKQR